jgi:ribosomal protein S18 acetylase RimI-like enzyme
MISIGPLRLSERARWGELWSEYQTFYGVALPSAVTESTWQRIHGGRVCGLGARNSADYLVGIVHYLFHEDTWSTAPACYLQDLYVGSTSRGTGCGRTLIEAVAESARAAGANSPYWLTHHSNVLARQLYDRLGHNQGFIQYAYKERNEASNAACSVHAEDAKHEE